MATVRAELQIIGLVQGVWYRQSTKQTAEKHGVSGWIRNRPDGSVEAVLEGEPDAVQQVIDWCKQGPQMAQVDEVRADWKEASGEFSSFAVRC